MIITLFQLIAIGALLSGSPPEAAAREVNSFIPQEHQIKAAVVFNFAKFVEWPQTSFPDDGAPLVLGILDQEPLARAMEGLAGKSVQGRKLVVKRSNQIEDLKKCHIFFCGSPNFRDLPQILASLKSLPVLTITDDMENLERYPGIINLRVVEDRIRFEINLAEARNAGLKISSHLLKLALRVIN